MKNFLQISSDIDVIPLLLAIRRRPELWREDTYLRDYPQGPFGEIDSIMLRFPAKTVCETEIELENHFSMYDIHESIDYPPYKLLPEARELIMKVMARVSGERLGRCMINRVRPGGKIHPHADTPEHANYYDRFHLVLETNEKALFRAEDEMVQMRTGDLWWFQNAVEHEVRNEGDTDRVHLIIDIKTSK